MAGRRVGVEAGGSQCAFAPMQSLNGSCVATAELVAIHACIASRVHDLTYIDAVHGQLADAKAEVETAVLGRMREEQDALEAEFMGLVEQLNKSHEEQVCLRSGGGGSARAVG